MAYEITFVNEDNIEFLSSVSLSSLKEAFFCTQNSRKVGNLAVAKTEAVMTSSDKSSSEESSEM